jgi:hypothetical protein
MRLLVLVRARRALPAGAGTSVKTSPDRRSLPSDRCPGLKIGDGSRLRRPAARCPETLRPPRCLRSWFFSLLPTRSISMRERMAISPGPFRAGLTCARSSNPARAHSGPVPPAGIRTRQTVVLPVPLSPVQTHDVRGRRRTRRVPHPAGAGGSPPHPAQAGQRVRLRQPANGRALGRRSEAIPERLQGRRTLRRLVSRLASLCRAPDYAGSPLGAAPSAE